MKREYNGNEIAIIGIGCRFPKSSDWQQFWQNLVSGKDLVTFFSKEQLLARGISPELINSPNYVGAKAYLDDSECFDASFFGYSKREAQKMDPQLRALHEVSFNAFVDANIEVGEHALNTGVYLGSTLNLPRWGHFVGAENDIGEIFDISNYNDPASFAAQVAYRLKLHGPALHVQTACSTSLSAVHLACKSLLAGECEMAIAGGACVTDPVEGGYLYKEGMILSPDGRCKSFDKNANGTVNGNGVGVVLLKLLEDALANGDPIHALILETAMNNDGERKVSFEAPSVQGQMEAISQAYEVSEIPFDTLGMVEAHGTATKLGDPIEVQALTKVAKSLVPEERLRQFRCALGSVKSNMGHLDAAAGVAGLIKAALSVRYGVVPASLHFSAPNPELHLEDIPFYVPTEAEPWPVTQAIRRAGVSSFGIGGTNVHALLEQPPQSIITSALRPDSVSLSAYMFPLSAQSPQALYQRIKAFRRHILVEGDNFDFTKTAAQLQRVNNDYLSREVFIAGNKNLLLEQLSEREMLTGIKPQAHHYVWIFPGQGSQSAGMGLALAEQYNGFKTRYYPLLKQAAVLLEASFEDIIEKLKQPQQLTTLYAQPLIYALQTALAGWWRSLGCPVDGVLGFSVGEWAAAVIAGVVSPQQGMELVVTRAKLMESMPRGALFAVAMSRAEVDLPDFVWKITELSPRSATLAVAEDDVERAEQWLHAQDFNYKRMAVSHAFHTPLIESAAIQFRRVLEKQAFSPASLAVYSTLEGRLLEPQEMCNSDYWVKQMLRPIQWSAALKSLFSDDPTACLLQIGSGNDLLQQARKWVNLEVDQLLTTLGTSTEENEVVTAQLAAAQFWCRGHCLDWSQLQPDLADAVDKPRTHLPAHLFEKQTFSPLAQRANRDDFGDERCYVPHWQPCTPLFTVENAEHSNKVVWIICPDVGEFEQRLAELATGFASEVKVIRLSVGDIDATSAYTQLTKQLQAGGFTWSSAMDIVITGLLSDLDASSAQIWAFWLPTAIARWSTDQAQIDCLRLIFLASQLLSYRQEEFINPFKRQLLGPVFILPEEYKGLESCCVDISDVPSVEAILELIEPWLKKPWKSGQLYCYRANQYWKTELQSDMAMQEKNTVLPEITANSWVMITGATGGMGTAIAEHLAQTYHCNLVLVIRQTLPKRSRWDDEISKETSAASLILWLKKLEALGSHVTLITADFTRPKTLLSAFKPILECCQRGIRINYVFHTAGRAEGALLQLRDESESLATLGPKVDGTAFLANLVAELGHPTFLLFSSLGNLLAKEKVGQIAYVSANACLEAFADKLRNEGHCALAVAWDDWAEGGMANRSAQSLDQALKGVEPSEQNPEEGGWQWIYPLLPTDDWLLDEHRLDADNAVMPAMGFITLIYRAYAQACGRNAQLLALENVIISTALQVNNSDQRSIAIVFDTDLTQVTIYSGDNKFCPERWQKHVTAQLIIQSSLKPQPILMELPLEKKLFEAQGSGVSPHGALQLGARWRNVTCVTRIGENEVLVHLALAPEFAGEAPRLALHAGLLDTATLIDSPEREDLQFMPLSFGKFCYYAPMQDRLISRVSYQDIGDNKILQLSLYSESGELLVTIKDLMLVKTAVTAEDKHQVYRLDAHVQKEGNFSFNAHQETRAAPADNEVEIEVRAAGLNFKDVLIVLGLVPAPDDPSMTFGQEAAGVVTRIGANVTQFAVGDHVMAAGYSCFAEHVLMDQSVVAKLPLTLGYQQGATVPVAFTTAWLALVKAGRIKSGDKVLIHSAASGVGMAALQIALRFDCEVYATAGNSQKRHLLLELGAHGVADSRSVEFAEIFRTRLGDRPFDVVVNALAGELLEESLKLLSPQGRFVELGLRDILGNKPLGLSMFSSGGSFHALQAGALHPDYAEAWHEVVDGFNKGQLKPLPVRTFAADELDAAFEKMAQGRHIGKFAIRFPHRNREQGFVSKLKQEGLTNQEGVSIAMAMVATARNSNHSYIAISRLPIGIVLEKQTDTQQMLMAGRRLSTVIDEKNTEHQSLKGKSAEVLLVALEKMLSKFLDIDTVDVDATFFALGATSLDLIQFAKLLEARLESEVSVALLFKAASLRQLSLELAPEKKIHTDNPSDKKKLSYKRKFSQARRKLRQGHDEGVSGG